MWIKKFSGNQIFYSISESYARAENWKACKWPEARVQEESLSRQSQQEFEASTASGDLRHPSIVLILIIRLAPWCKHSFNLCHSKIIHVNICLHLQANKKTLSMKSKHEIAREVLSPFFTPTQIDCFCRPKWLRSRNWTEKDFEIALSLRKLMSKKAFGFLRKKRMIPMPR